MTVRLSLDLIQTFPPDVLYHGTGKKYLESIQKDGLIPKSRLYVHLSGDTEVAENVGKRHGEVVILSLIVRLWCVMDFCFIGRLIMFG